MIVIYQILQMQCFQNMGDGLLFMELVVKKRRRVLKGKHSEVILIVDCEDTQAELIENILWSHFAIGVAKVR